MAGSQIDPLDLSSWEDAFAQPIPTVRKLEQQLRRHADDNREQLRTLVGVSYRDLLGTAERIIIMNQQIQEAEVLLGQTGQKCNARSVEKISQNFRRMQRAWKSYSISNGTTHESAGLASRTTVERNGIAAQLAVLESCSIVITRLLRKNGSLLLASKLLLLSRLIHKTLSQDADVPPYVDKLKDRLASLRIKLLRAVDKRFAAIERDVAQIVEDMCAFSLATSSTPSDILQHFLKVRLRFLRLHLEQTEGLSSHAMQSMTLLLGTLQKVQLIFPKRLSEALLRLKDVPLIRQHDVHTVTELNLKLHISWLTDELKTYTPWPRHDELQKVDADRLLRNWAKTAQRAFVAGLDAALSNEHSFETILDVRRQIFQAWPWSNARLPGLHTADVIDQLRGVFNTRLQQLVQAKVKDLELVSQSMRETVVSSSDQAGMSSLWSSDITSLEVGDGAQTFKEALLSHYNGTGGLQAAPTESFEAWLTSMKEIQAEVKQMRNTQWDDEFNDDDDDDDLGSRAILLSQDDSLTLSEFFKAALIAQASTFQSDLESSIKFVIQSDHNAREAAIILRVLRGLLKRSSVQNELIAAPLLLVMKSEAIIHPLHEKLATNVCGTVKNMLDKGLARFLRSKTKTPGTLLWEGQPALPVQPSVFALKFLRSVIDAMTTLGADLWSDFAIVVLKRGLSTMVASSMNQHLEAATSSTTQTANGLPSTVSTSSAAEGSSKDEAELETDETEAAAKLPSDKLVQLLFDLHFLNAALSVQKIQDRSPRDPIQMIIDMEGVQDLQLKRLHKNANDHWKRTYLLYALLNSGNR